MKFVTFARNGQERLGALDAKRGILDLKEASAALPDRDDFVDRGRHRCP